MIDHLTPTQYAAKIGMSRAHVSRLVERGELAVLVIDGVTYVNPAGMAAFEERRDRERAQLAWAFAHQAELREAAIEELARHL